MGLPLLDGGQQAVAHGVGLGCKEARDQLKERRDVAVEFPEVLVDVGVQPDQVGAVDSVSAGRKHGRLDEAVEIGDVNPVCLGGGDGAVELLAHVLHEAVGDLDEGWAHEVRVHGLVLEVPYTITHLEGARTGKRLLAAARVVVDVALIASHGAAEGIVDGDDDDFGRV